MSARVLIVDDNDLNRELVSQLLEDDYTIETACNGAEAIEVVASFEPEVVLMDLSMPVMDGWEATRRLRTNGANRGLKIIALTAHALPDEIERAMAAGCDGFLTKPIDDEALIERIEELLAG